HSLTGARERLSPTHLGQNSLCLRGQPVHAASRGTQRVKSPPRASRTASQAVERIGASGSSNERATSIRIGSWLGVGPSRAPGHNFEANQVNPLPVRRRRSRSETPWEQFT